MEARLSEALAHRFQASGKVAVFLTREWRNLRSGPNFMVKIKDCSPDELTPSSFVRFSIWDQGKELGSFAEPVRMAHYVEVFYSKAPLVRGTRLSSSGLSSRLVDILKQHAGSVPAQSNLVGYQLSANIKANAPSSGATCPNDARSERSDRRCFCFRKRDLRNDERDGPRRWCGRGIVNIRNLSSDKEFPAKVLNENSVKVHL